MLIGSLRRGGRRSGGGEGRGIKDALHTVHNVIRTVRECAGWYSVFLSPLSLKVTPVPKAQRLFAQNTQMNQRMDV